MKADPTLQWRLLDLQAVDSRLDQIAHARRTMPQIQQLDTLDGDLRVRRADLVNAQTARADVQLEIDRAESDVHLVRERLDRDRARLAAGTGSAKDLQAIQHEIASLERRQAALEDTQLEIMERAEGMDERVATLGKRVDEAAAERERLAGERDARLAELAADERAEQAKRAHIAPGVGDALLALYDRIRQQAGGLAAAMLRAGRCGGCQMQLTPVDLQRIRAAADDEVLRCEDCGRIMVRTAESGL